MIITPPSGLAELPSVIGSPTSTDPTTTTLTPEPLLHLNDDIELYPIMRAELVGANFDISSDGQPEKSITGEFETVWTWTVSPRSRGEQTLALIVSIPVRIADASETSRSAMTLKSIDIPITVRTDATPTPLPTEIPSPTPTFGQKIRENVTSNFTVLLGAALTAILGSIAGWVALARYRDERRGFKKKVRSGRRK